MPAGVGAHFFEVCDSTNRLAAELAARGEPGPLWIVAGKQAFGQGRRGRTWSSDEGNLYASLLYRPTLRPGDLKALPFLVALAVRETFISLGAAPRQVRCKWPNDILLDGKKASGVLIESSAKSPDRLDYLIIGIGINLVRCPQDAAFPATSLHAAAGAQRGVEEAMKSLAWHLFDRLTAWNTENFSTIAQEWTAAAWGLGQAYRLRTSTETFTGTPVALGEDGGLIVKLDDGGEKRLYAGDIFPISGLEQETDKPCC